MVIEPKEDITGGVKIGEAITEVSDYKPGKLIVTRYVRSKYALPGDQGAVIGQLPSLPIPRGNVGSGLLAQLVISKFVDHLPFYLQVRMFKRFGVTLAESVVNDWVRSSCDLLEPLYECLKEKVLQGDYLMADETPISVLTEDKPGATHKGYHWVCYSPVQRLVLFDYQKGLGWDGATERIRPKGYEKNINIVPVSMFFTNLTWLRGEQFAPEWGSVSPEYPPTRQNHLLIIISTSNL